MLVKDYTLQNLQIMGKLALAAAEAASAFAQELNQLTEEEGYLAEQISTVMKQGCSGEDGQSFLHP